MNTSLKWIKDLVPGLDCTPQEYMDAMTLSGSKAEGYEKLFQESVIVFIQQTHIIDFVFQQRDSLLTLHLYQKP